jgi:hypothetical protein
LVATAASEESPEEARSAVEAYQVVPHRARSVCHRHVVEALAHSVTADAKGHPSRTHRVAAPASVHLIGSGIRLLL